MLHLLFHPKIFIWPIQKVRMMSQRINLSSTDTTRSARWGFRCTSRTRGTPTSATALSATRRPGRPTPRYLYGSSTCREPWIRFTIIISFYLRQSQQINKSYLSFSSSIQQATRVRTSLDQFGPVWTSLDQFGSVRINFAAGLLDEFPSSYKLRIQTYRDWLKYISQVRWLASWRCWESHAT